MKQNKSANKLVIVKLLIIILTTGSGCFLYSDAVHNELNLVRVKITSVIDGDTAYALFPGGKEEKVRFIGVDAPEVNHPYKGREFFGHEAEIYTRTELQGRYLWLEFDQSERDQYGRLLAYLWLSVPEKTTDYEIREKMFNARLLIEGYAIQVIFPPNTKYVNNFAVYEAEARAAGRGLWGETENSR